MTVPPFRPYGGEDIRVVSDVSRFDYGETDQKIRSRNTTLQDQLKILMILYHQVN